MFLWAVSGVVSPLPAAYEAVLSVLSLGFPSVAWNGNHTVFTFPPFFYSLLSKPEKEGNTFTCFGKMA